MTRAILALALVWLAACSGDGGDSGCDYKGRHFHVGDQFADACNDCSCTSDGVECTAVFCNGSSDANPGSCESSPGCDGFGPLCNGSCCNAGEHCVDDVCTCGDHAGCGDQDVCGGPAMQNACGSLCCGGSGPCPL